MRGVRAILMKITIGIVFTVFVLCHSAAAGTTQHNWFNMSWGNGVQIEGSSKAQWYLTIQKEDLTKDSFCNFGKRVFDPSPAIKSAFRWMKSEGHDSGNFRLYEITIFTMGQDWKHCVYIVELYDSIINATMRIGVSLDGERVYAPVKF